jgi:hypothetical protein
VPPLNEVVVESVELWPLSMVVGEAVITGATGVPMLTATVTTLEVVVSGEAALSVTWSSKDQVPELSRTPVEIDGFEEVVHPLVNETPRSPKFPAPGASSSHWQV